MDPERQHGKVRSTCGLCQAGCGIRVHMAAGKPVQIEGDPDSPVNRGVLCAKAQSSLETLYHRDRLTHPLKRIGEKGSGQWREITWEEALDLVAHGLDRAKERHGPESLAFMRGAFKGGYTGAFLARFANALGAPNIASMASVCYVPRVYGSVFTCGYHPLPDYEYPPACIVVWGANLAETRIGEHYQTVKAVEKGSKLIVIDPRRTTLASKADLWVRLKPGSDLALALAMMNVLINEELYDRDFVQEWTIGFEELQQHIQPYTPEAMEEATWVQPSVVKALTRLYATRRPGVIQTGNAIDHTSNNFQTARAVSILRALTGNLGVPGGELDFSFPPVRLPLGSSDLDLRDNLSSEERAKRLNARDGLLPTVFYALPQSMIRAMAEGQPYGIHAGYVQGGNLLLSYTNAQRTFDALKRLEFLAVAELFMTPTAALADVVLPVASYLEYDGIIAPPYYPVVQVQQRVAQRAECKSDYGILRALAERLGIEAYFWEEEKQCLDYILEPAGLKFEEFRQVGVLQGKKEYRKHEKEGFSTPSKKVEVWSESLDAWGFDPMPAFHKPPGALMGGADTEYPLVLTSWKSGCFRHSGGRQISSLRALEPDPVIWIHPETAYSVSVREGEWVYVETRKGRIRQKAGFNEEIDPRVVGVGYGWWFPEKGAQGFFGWNEANMNVLTDDQPPYGKELGTPDLRGIPCRIVKA